MCRSLLIFNCIYDSIKQGKFQAAALLFSLFLLNYAYTDLGGRSVAGA